MVNITSVNYVLDACQRILVGSQFIATVKSVLLKSSDETVKKAYLDIFSALAGHGEPLPDSRQYLFITRPDDTRFKLLEPDMISLVYGLLQNQAMIVETCNAVSMLCKFGKTCVIEPVVQLLNALQETLVDSF